MSILGRILGNAAKVSTEDAQGEFQRILCPGERIQHAYKLIRDFFLFTDRRLILVDKQGLTGKKTEYHTVPYKSITHFSVETAGRFDLDAEMKIWVSGSPHPFKKKFNRQVNIYEVQATLASYVLPRESLTTVTPPQGRVPLPHDPTATISSRQPQFSDTQMPEWTVPELSRPADAESEAKALFESARAAVKAKNRDQAVLLLERIVREYPDTNAATLARNSLGTVKPS